MSIEGKFPQKKPNHRKSNPGSEFDPDRNFYKKEENEMHDAREELENEIHEKIEKERLARPQNIFVNNNQLKKLKTNGELNLPGVKFYDRVVVPGEKIILAGENEKIEAEFVKIIGDPTQSGTVTIHVHLIK
jgi:hypothetical protein